MVSTSPRRTLRPTRHHSDVDLRPFPDLHDVSPQFVRDSLKKIGSRMRKSLAHIRVTTAIEQSTLPRKVSIQMDDNVEFAPSHMLAVYKPSNSQVTLYPTHHIVLAAHCANLPQLPPSSTDDDHSLPVIPLCLPFPEAFPDLQTYLYTKRLDLLHCWIKRANPVSRIMAIHANASALGIVDAPLYHMLNTALKRATCPY